LTGANQNHVAIAQLGYWDLLEALASDPCSHIRKEFRKFLQSPTRLRDRPHLDPVTEEHDGHKSGELLPERNTGETNFNRNAEHECDRNRQSNQRHHAWQTVTQFACSSLEENQPTDEKDEGSKDGREDVASWNMWRRKSECIGEHMAPYERGHGKGQRHPKLAPEH
jgi:hypothetical protein